MKILSTTKVYSQRIYIPKEVRQKFSIKDGDTLIWGIEENRIILFTQESEEKKTRFKVNPFKDS